MVLADKLLILMAERAYKTGSCKILGISQKL